MDPWGQFLYQRRDSKNVHVMSNAHDPQDEGTVERKLPCGNTIQVTCPKAMKDYNKWMGGVYFFDQKKKCLRSRQAVKKGWYKIFYFMIVAAIVNAFIQYSGVRGGNSADLLRFKLILGCQLVKRRPSALEDVTQTTREKNRHHSGSFLSGVPDEVRFQGNNHFPKPSNTIRCR